MLSREPVAEGAGSIANGGELLLMGWSADCVLNRSREANWTGGWGAGRQAFGVSANRGGDKWGHDMFEQLQAAPDAAAPEAAAAVKAERVTAVEAQQAAASK